MKKNWGWMLVLTILMPLFYFLWVISDDTLFLAETMFLPGLIFAPVGFVGAWVMFWLLNKSKSTIQKRATVVAFTLFFPIAFFSSLFSTIAFYWLGPLIFGIIPLVAVTAIGYWIGGLLASLSKS